MEIDAKFIWSGLLSSFSVVIFLLVVVIFWPSISSALTNSVNNPSPAANNSSQPAIPISACEGQDAAPVSTACLNDVWKASGCTTTIPADYSGWWKQQPKSVIDKDMAIYGASSKPSTQFTTCHGPFA